MSPDGSYLLFISNRPLAKGANLRDGFYNGKKWPMRGTHYGGSIETTRVGRTLFLCRQ
ncbi:hypothetical protein HDF16_005161 [Granulicella aggregans]|uniref:WD40 repeat protein n=1 Tax=Granulicella aggregans TaxID=474949 RepID=A0A7W8E7M3_9BACT|nr:hypothetical protein [Granulicella aggregans]